MSVYSEEEHQFALRLARYRTINYGSVSWFVSTLPCAELGPGPGWNNILAHMTWWVIHSVGLYGLPGTLRGNLVLQGGWGWRGPAVDKQSFNSWWSGLQRGERSPLLKPLVQHCLSTLPPCWLHEAKVLCDRLQTLLFCFVLSASFFNVLLFFPPSSGLQEFRGRLKGGWVLTSWLLLCTVRWGLADVQLCLLFSFPWHFPQLRLAQIPISWARTLSAVPDDCGWKMNYPAGICLTDRASCDCTHVEEAAQKRSVWPCRNYLVAFPFVVKASSQDRTFTNILDLQNPWALQLHEPGAKNLWRSV